MELVTSMGVVLDDDLRPINKAMYAAALIPGGEFLPIATFVAWRPVPALLLTLITVDYL